jgi:hypothetical protein
MLAHRRFNGPAPHKLHINVDRGSMQLSPKRGLVAAPAGSAG